MVRHGSAKAECVGSIPALASEKFSHFHESMIPSLLPSVAASASPPRSDEKIEPENATPSLPVPQLSASLDEMYVVEEEEYFSFEI